MTVRQCESKLKGGRDVGTLLGTKGGTGKKHAYVYMNPNFSLNTTSRALKLAYGNSGTEREIDKHRCKGHCFCGGWVHSFGYKSPMLIVEGPAWLAGKLVHNSTYFVSSSPW